MNAGSLRSRLERPSASGGRLDGHGCDRSFGIMPERKVGRRDGPSESPSPDALAAGRARDQVAFRRRRHHGIGRSPLSAAAADASVVANAIGDDRRNGEARHICRGADADRRRSNPEGEGVVGPCHRITDSDRENFERRNAEATCGEPGTLPSREHDDSEFDEVVVNAIRGDRSLTRFPGLNRPDFRSWREPRPAGAGWPDCWSAQYLCLTSVGVRMSSSPWSRWLFHQHTHSWVTSSTCSTMRQSPRWRMSSVL